MNPSIECPGRFETGCTVEDVRLDLEPGEILSLVGECYRGKSADARVSAGL
jgi:ABC-type glutathione transport system ATPase component